MPKTEQELEDELFAGLSKKQEVKTDIGQAAMPADDDALFDLVNESPASTQATSNLSITQDLIPDKEAEIYNLAKQANLPTSTVRLVPEEVKKKLEYPVDMSTASQGMLRYYGSSHSAAAISRDDTENLKRAEVSFGQKLKRSFARGETNVEIGNLRSQQLFGDVSEETERRIQELKAGPEPQGLEPLEPVGTLESWALQAAEQAPIQAATLAKGLERGLFGAITGASTAVIAGQLGPQALAPEEVITVPLAAAGGFGLGFKAGSAEAIFKLEAGFAHDELLTFRDENNEPLDPGVIWATSIGVGAVNAGLEFASLRALLKTIPGAGKLLDKVTTEQITEVLKSKTVRQKLFDIGKKYAGAVTIESLTEAAQESVTIIGGELAKGISDEEGAQFPKIGFPEAAKRALSAGEAAIGPTIIFGAPGSIVGVYQAVNNVNDSNDFFDNITKDKKSIGETLTAQRSRDHAKQFIENIDADADVYISSEGINKLYQSHTVEETNAILEKIGVIPEKARETITTGEDTTVKAKEILTLDDEEFAALRDDVKEAPGAYTQREITEQKANEDVENSVNLLKEDTAKAEQVNTEIERIKEEGKKAGLATDVVENAPILMKGLADRLSLEGIDSVEFLKKIGIKKEMFAGIKEIFQAAPKGPRGAIPISNESHLISLFEGADMSTVLHEVGHIALKEYTSLEETGQASDLLKNDMVTIRKWVGATGKEFTTPQLEQFARGFEAYLLEGKAPTVELRTAFERFKNWMVQTYKTVKGLNVKLNAPVRKVFDRMLSANLEVEAAAASGGFTIKTTAEMNALGVNKTDQIFATRLIEQTKKKAERRLNTARNKNYRDNIKTWKEEARREIRNEFPIYNTIDSIIKDGYQLDYDTFIEAGQGTVSELPTARLLKKDGANIDMVAALYEFTDAQTMINLFIATPKFSEAVNQRVNIKEAHHDAQFLVEDYIVDLPEYRDYLNIMARYITSQTIDEEVISKGIQQNIKRWETESRTEITTEQPELSGAELEKAITDRTQQKIDNWQRNKAKPSVISTDTLKKLARDTMAAKSVREAQRVDKYLSAMKKASSDERRAILKENWGEASRASELSRFNYEMASLSVKAREEVKKVQANAKKSGKSNNIDFEHREAILNLINQYNIASLAPSDPTSIPDYNKLFAGDDYGNDGFPIPDFFTGNAVNDFRDLSLGQLRELDSAIKYLAGQGNINNKEFLSDGNTRLQDVVDESVEVQNKVKRLKVWETGSMMRKLSDVSRSLFAMLDSLTFTAKSLDGYTNLGKDGIKGPVERFVIDRIKESGANLTKHGTEIKAMVDPHLDQISKTILKWHKKFGNRIQVEGAPVPALMRADGQTKGWKSQQIFAVVLNTGNVGEASNYENLLAGYPDLTPAMVENIKAMLSVEDMRAVQGIWDAINSLFPQVDAQHLKTKNYRMSKVAATPFTFKGESFKGGYYPVKHNRELSYKVDDRGKVEDLFNKDAAGFTTPYAKLGSTIKRLRGVALPLLLDLGVIDSHFRDTLQYIHYSDAIRDADRITRSAEFREAATRILGKDVYNTIRPALKHIANPVRAGLDIPMSRGIEWMRGKSTAYVLAWNTGVAIKQPLSTFGAIRDMGAKAYAKGFVSAFASPSAHYQKMIELSPYMKDRLTAFDREIKSQFLKLSAEQRGVYFGDTKVTWQDVKNFGFWQIRIADTTTVLPIWHGAFNDKLLDDQSNLQEAINYADDLVRNSQPSAQALDLSAWQRDGGAIRLFSQFQTFTVGKYGQRQRLFYRAWRNGSVSNVDYAWFNFMDAFVPLVAINLLQSLLWGNDLGDEETQQEIMIDVLQSWAFMGVPLVSSVARSVFRYGDPFDSPVLETANKATRGVVAGFKGLNGFENRKERDQALWGVAHTASILSGVPVSKMVQRAQKGAKQKKGVPGIKYLVPAPPNKR